MNIAIDGKTRNYIFMAVLSVVIIVLIVAFLSAVKQNKVFKNDYTRYQQAQQLIHDQKCSQALTLLAQLDQPNRESYQVQLLQAACAVNTGDLQAAAGFMEKARKTRPALVTDQDYMLKYGMILSQLGDYDRARLYLLESKKYNTYPEDIKTADQYLDQIDNKSPGGRN